MESEHGVETLARCVEDSRHELGYGVETRARSVEDSRHELGGFEIRGMSSECGIEARARRV
jgi:hypothetical protein